MDGGDYNASVILFVSRVTVHADCYRSTPDRGKAESDFIILLLVIHTVNQQSPYLSHRDITTSHLALTDIHFAVLLPCLTYLKVI